MSFIEAISTQPPSFRVPCLFLYTSLSHPKLKWALMVKMMIPRTTSIRELGISAILCIILEPFFSAAKKKDVRRIPNGLLLASSAITTPSFPMELLNRIGKRWCTPMTSIAPAAPAMAPLRIIAARITLPERIPPYCAKLGLAPQSFSSYPKRVL